MKKSMALILVLVMLVGMLAACGTSSDTPTDEPEATDTPTQAPATEGPAGKEPDGPGDPRAVELPLVEDTVYFDLWMATMPGLAESGITIGDGYYFNALEELTNVGVEITEIPVFSAAEQFAIMFSSGNYPDMVEGGMQFYIGSPDSAIEDGIIYSFDDFIEEWMPNYWYWLNSDEKFTRAAKSVEGHYYAAHCLYVEHSGASTGTLIRKDMVEGVGMDLPVTYDEFYEVLSAIKVEYDSAIHLDSAGSLPGAMFASGYDVMPYITNGSLEALAVIDGVVEFSPVQEGYYKYLETLNKFWEAGLIYSDFMSATTGSRLDEELVLNSAICLIAGAADEINYYSDLTNGEVQYIGVQAAAQTHDQKIHIRDVNSILTEGTVITTDCENLELAAKWLDYQYTDEAALMANYGEQGVSMTYDDDGNPRLTDMVLNNPDGLTNGQALAVYARGDGSYPYNATRLQVDFNEDQKATLDAWRKADEEYMYPDRCKLTADESSQYSTIMSDVQTFVQEWTLQFILGTKSLENDWDAYIATLESMNYEEGVALKQTAYDRYMAS